MSKVAVLTEITLPSALALMPLIEATTSVPLSRAFADRRADLPPAVSYR
jgi:hypothetical protein